MNEHQSTLRLQIHDFNKIAEKIHQLTVGTATPPVGVKKIPQRYSRIPDPGLQGFGPQQIKVEVVLRLLQVGDLRLRQVECLCRLRTHRHGSHSFSFRLR
ncbi:7, 8-dihydro-6-hydroxymethylpterin-pyrophosphokinase [Pseudomonas syringae pv. actinidiae]|uniref:7, 8-dihydro-6-hydroxymethylpterin-pyrophosphokinase n=1 Tax=Pseudomonas syringae pv. actinidiae TaxID=103796 RepID=A0A2V0QCT3_PSESF|nr:7, 8-dihydro-6-hydroxymethylpterin-pyrophosphokinase [Pseudomonas syringae pv. actinidiae]